MTTESGTTVPVAGTPPATSTPAAVVPETKAAQTPDPQAVQQQLDADGKPVVVAPASSEPLTLEEKPAVAVAPVVGEKVGAEVKYDPTGNAKLDISLAFLGKLGIDPDHPGMKAAGNGDFSILKAHLATLGAKAQGWEANIALGEQAIADQTAASKDRSAKDRKAMTDAVGGEETWVQVREFARAATEDSPSQREEVNRALQGGGIAGIAMAQYLHTLFLKNSPTQEPKAATVPVVAQTPAGPARGYALSPREYTAEVAKLNIKLGGRMDTSPEYKELGARRRAWRDPRG